MFIDQRLLVPPPASMLAHTHTHTHTQIDTYTHTHTEFRNDTFCFVTRSTQYCEISIGIDSEKGDGADSDSVKVTEPDDPVYV